MITAFILDAIIILALAIFVIVAGTKMKIPGVVGFLVTGMIAGPYGLGLVRDPQMVDALAEIGIVFLLFSIGMQFSFKTLFEMKKIVLVAGTLQVVLTILAVYAIMVIFHIPAVIALFMGLLICHSSTTITLKIFQDRGEVNTPYARSTLGISLYQDIMTVPMLIALPILAGHEANLSLAILNLGLTLLLLLVLVYVVAAWILPRVMPRIVSVRKTEIFLLSIILICFVITFLSSKLGLSLALGAFLAGLTLSESEYFHQAFVSIVPFRDMFTSFFFISVGMLLNLWFVLENPVLIIALVIGVLLLKAVIAAGSMLCIGQSLRTSVLAGLALCNIGEFAFVLSVPGQGYGLFPGTSSQVFLAVTVITMALTPFIIIAGPQVADRVCRLPLGNRLRAGCSPPEPEILNVPSLSDHTVIIGYGLNGRHLSKVAKIGNIPYIIIEMNPETVRQERARGEPIFFGDATNEAILSHAQIEQARLLVVAVNDPLSTRIITRISRSMNPRLWIIVRTQFLPEVGVLRDLGADEVIPEEFETSVEIFSRVLKKYLIPKGTIENAIRDIRADTYQVLRDPAGHGTDLSELRQSIPDMDITILNVSPDSPVAGKTLSQLNIRRDFRVSILAIRRQKEILANPSGETDIQPGDDLVVMGAPADITRLSLLVRPGDGQE
ncbi:MAG: potassium transporter KefB [Methanomicrobiales archaeon]|nr:potassium transporter KefB [Methanomicrobiales archaeon]